MIPRPDSAVVALFPIVAGLLAAAPILIAAAAIPLRRRAPALVRELWLRYATWVALAGLALGALALGPWPWGACFADFVEEGFDRLCEFVACVSSDGTRQKF